MKCGHERQNCFLCVAQLSMQLCVMLLEQVHQTVITSPAVAGNFKVIAEMTVTIVAFLLLFLLQDQQWSLIIDYMNLHYTEENYMVLNMKTKMPKD